MKHIRAFLQTFSDQNLTNLQAACEDRTMHPMVGCRCIRAFWSDTQRYSESMTMVLALAAERELIKYYRQFTPHHWPENIHKSCLMMLDLIADEWARRKPVPQLITKDQLVSV